MAILVDRDALTCIGVVIGPHGREGTLKVAPETDSPEYYTAVTTAYVDAASGLRQVTVVGWRMAGNHWLIELEGIADREAAGELGGGELLLEATQLRPLAPGEFFRHDLVGCTVLDEAGATVGEVTGLMDNTAQHLLVVRGADHEVLLPLVDEIVTEVDLERREIRVRPPPGLLELNG